MHETDWLPGIIALALGLIGGVILWLLAGRKGAAPVQVHGHAARIDDLRARKETLIARLRELQIEIEMEKDPAVAARLNQERSRLEMEAAEVLRDLHRAESDEGAAAAPESPAVPSSGAAPAVDGRAAAAAALPAGRGFFASRPVLRGFLWGAGSATFLFALAFFLLDFLPGGGSHVSRAPGGPMTGGDAVVADSARAGQAQPDPELEMLRSRVVAEPSNLEAKLDLAQGMIFRDLLVDAFGVVQEVSRVEPNNPRALTYEAVVRLAMGQGELSMELLDKAVKADPKLTEAWVRRGLTAFELERYQVAIDSWEEALAQRPDGAPALRPVIEEARLRLSGGSAAARPQGLPPDHPNAGQAPAAGAQSPAEAAGPGVRLTIDLDPSAADKVQPGSILFVYARPAGVLSGPPTAAKRLNVSGFPIEIELTQADSMMGQPLPAKVAIEARVDRDGDPMTRDPADPIAQQDGLEAGKPPARLVLR